MMTRENNLANGEAEEGNEQENSDAASSDSIATSNASFGNRVSAKNKGDD